MKVVITGAGGMLGHALAKVFGDADELFFLDRDELDITDSEAVRAKIEEAKPDVVVNAAAYTNVDGAEEEEGLATKINGAGVHNVAEAASAVRAKFVHYSTDYVFRGDREQGYDESFDGYDPVNAYGRSKLAGEQALLNLGPGTLNWYLIRTSWLYGPNGKNFVDTMLRLGRERDELKVINDQHGKPTYVRDLAQATRKILEGDRASGVYHVTNETPQEGITWYDFACEIFRHAGIAVKVHPCTSEEYPLPAKRPTYSMLVNTKLPRRRDWKDALADYLRNEA